MKTKLRKQFLLAHKMEMYERFHMLRQNNISVEEYTSEFNNLLSQVDSNESNELVTSCHLLDLNQPVKDEIGVV